jgi:hypothetical protein
MAGKPGTSTTPEWGKFASAWMATENALETAAPMRLTVYLVLLGDSPRVSGCIGLGRFGSGGGDGGADCAMRRSYGVDAMATIQRTTSVASSPIAT